MTAAGAHAGGADRAGRRAHPPGSDSPGRPEVARGTVEGCHRLGIDEQDGTPARRLAGVNLGAERQTIDPARGVARSASAATYRGRLVPIACPPPAPAMAADVASAGRRPGPHSGPGGAGPQSLADITERLFNLFHGRLNLQTIVRVVRHCHRELEITRRPVPLHAVEQLSRRRLNDLVEHAPAAPGGPTAQAGRHR